MSFVPTHIALLRAINVAGRFYKMADVRTCLTASGLEDVETYIQTGNVRFRSTMRSRARLERHVEDVLRESCGFDVPAILLSPAELAQVYVDALGLPSPLEGDELRRYVMFLREAPIAAAIAPIDAWDYDGERAKVVGSAVHVWLSKPMHEAKFTNARFEKALGVGTTRDLKVVTTLAERWGS